jgi:carbamoyltransferase
MFLAPEYSPSPDFSGLNVVALPPESMFKDIAIEIADGRLVAVHQGRMEFGPRALGNRSLLLDPRDQEILIRTNKRLKRTEFMPFAPMVLSHEFNNYFETKNATMQPFEYMTMTCKVRDEVVSRIPAVTHVDQTARPQTVSLESNQFCFKILESFQAITGLPVLVNTSLNVHEEPINYALEDTLSCLRRGAIDVIYTENSRITLANEF